MLADCCNIKRHEGYNFKVKIYSRYHKQLMPYCISSVNTTNTGGDVELF